MRRWLLGAALCLALPAGPGAARADDWQVSRSPFDPRLLAQLKGQLCAHPDDTATLRRLVGLYRSYKNVDELQRELSERAKKSGAAEDLLCAGQVARERGRPDEAIALFNEALGKLPAGEGKAGRVDRAAVQLWLAEIAAAAAPPDTQEALRQIDAALASLGPKDPRRQKALRRAADLSRGGKDPDAYERRLRDLLALGRGQGGGDEALRRELAEALGRGGKAKEAIAEWRRLADKKSGPERAELELRVGEQQEVDKDDLGAIGSYRAALQLLPRDHHLRLDLYERLVSAHRRRDDLPALLKALESEWPAAGRGFLEWQLLGRLYDECGDLPQAQAAYRAALGKNAHHIDTRRRLIAVLERSGQAEEVLREYERLQRDAPGEARYYLELAERLDKAGQRQKALAVLARAAARFSGDPSLHSALSDLYQRWGEAALALKEAELLARLDPRDEGHIINLGELYWAGGRKDKAEEVWKRLLTANPDKGVGQARLADVYAEHNMMGQAVELYQKALKADPQSLPLKRGLASAYERMNRPRDAAPLWEQLYFAAGKDRALQLEARQRLAALVGKDVRLRILHHGWQQRLRALLERPQSPAEGEVLALGLLCAESSLRLGRTGEAETTLTGLLKALPGGAARAEVLLALVPLYRQQHKLPEAIAALKEAAQLLPDRQKELYAQLAELSMQSYRDDEALGYAERAVSDAQGELRLGELLERKDDVPRAIAAYRRAIALDERLLRAHMALGRLHLRQGELDKAAAVFTEVAKKAPQEELVLEAGRKAIDLHEYLGTLPSLVHELTPLAHAYPQKPAYRRLLLSLYERYAAPLLQRARAGDAAARADLARLGQSGLKPLSEALVDGDGAEQRTAVALLGDLGNPAAAPALLQLAQGPQPAAPASSPKAAARPTPLFGVMAGGARPQIQSGPSEIDLRGAALVQAARLGDPKGAATLARLASSPEKQLRLGALYGLGRLGRLGVGLGKAEADTVLRALSDSSAEVQAMACLAAGALYRRRGAGAAGLGEPPPRLRPQLQQLIERGRRPEEGSELLAAACVRALGALREAAAVPLLSELLRDGNEEVERQAAWALGRIGDRRALQPLLRAAILKQAPVRQAAVLALAALGTGGASGAAGASGAGAAATTDRPAGDEDLAWPDPPGDDLQVDPRRILAALPPLPAAPRRLWLSAGASINESGAALREALREALRGHRDLRLRALSDLLPEGRGGALRLGPLEADLPEADQAALRPLRGELARALLPAVRDLALGAVPPEPRDPDGAGREREPDAAVRAAALTLLDQLAPAADPAPGEDVVAVLSRVALSDPALEIQAQAATLLSRRGERSLPVLERLLASPDRRLRLLALRCAQAPGAPALPAALLGRAQQDPDGYVREEARRLGPR